MYYIVVFSLKNHSVLIRLFFCILDNDYLMRIYSDFFLFFVHFRLQFITNLIESNIVLKIFKINKNKLYLYSCLLSVSKFLK